MIEYRNGLRYAEKKLVAACVAGGWAARWETWVYDPAHGWDTEWEPSDDPMVYASRSACEAAISVPRRTSHNPAS